MDELVTGGLVPTATCMPRALSPAATSSHAATNASLEVNVDWERMAMRLSTPSGAKPMSTARSSST